MHSTLRHFVDALIISACLFYKILARSTLLMKLVLFDWTVIAIDIQL